MVTVTYNPRKRRSIGGDRLASLLTGYRAAVMIKWQLWGTVGYSRAAASDVFQPDGCQNHLLVERVENRLMGGGHG